MFFLSFIIYCIVNQIQAVLSSGAFLLRGYYHQQPFFIARRLPEIVCIKTPLISTLHDFWNISKTTDYHINLTLCEVCENFMRVGQITEKKYEGLGDSCSLGKIISKIGILALFKYHALSACVCILLMVLKMVFIT